MSLGSFIRKQFIDILQWNEDGDGVLAGATRCRISKSSTAPA